MTERHAAYLVVLADNIREDDSGPILTALAQIKGVATVAVVASNDAVEQAAETRRDAAWVRGLARLARLGPDEDGLLSDAL